VKEKGNKAFMSKLYPEAIELYTKAIELKKDEPTFYINRKTSILPT
jgi:hypothetical protein